MFNWIVSYREMGKNHNYIDIGILVFIEKILSECLNELTFENSAITMKSRLFQSLKDAQKSIKEDEFLIYCFKEITRNLHT